MDKKMYDVYELNRAYAANLAPVRNICLFL